MTITIYHNPRCSKSRAALALLKERGINPHIVEYLDAPPTAEELKRILAMLGMRPRQLLRAKEAKDFGLDNPDLNDEALIAGMVAHPIVIERPIVVCGDQARLGRPTEKILEILPLGG